METLHGEALLDRESRKTVKQIDVEIKNVAVCLLVHFLSRFSGLVRFVAVANTFENPFYILRSKLQRKT